MVVLGAGPAGCAAATLLAKRAHDVVLIAPALPPAGGLAESVPPSARRILDELGMLETVERAGFHPNRGNVVWWAGEPARQEAFTDAEGGFHTDRAALEDALVGLAERVGVRCLRGVAARSCIEDSEGWLVRAENEAASGIEFRIRARWVIDATGRRGLLARSEGREPDRSTTTLALVRRWHRPEGWEDADRTLVESYADGWAWSVPLDSTTRCFTAMIDQRHADLSGLDVDAMLDAELGKTRWLGPLIEGASPRGPAWACPASLYTATRFGRHGLLLAGDAGSFIDPLSSFGVKKALSSGWLAGVVAHTALVDPAMATVAVDFFDAREREVYHSYRAVSVPFFEAGARTHGTAYWSERAEAARAVGGGDSVAGDARGVDDGEAPAPSGPRDDGFDPERLTPVVTESAVRAAFDEIRARAVLAAIPGSTLRTVERPAVDGHRIVLRDHLASDLFPSGMRYARGVDLLRLVEIAGRHPVVPDGWAAYNGVAPPVTLPDYLTALATAFAAGFLEHDDA